jgi:lipopolysaccharide transport system ATP-binding protein
LFNRSEQISGSSDVVALQPVEFTVPAGQKLGILGTNGSGKSTLLKLLARISEPSSGEAFIRGRVAAILEVGTGFHPELTGAENVFLNGAILGLKRSFIMERMASITAFAELDDAMNLPVKRYSSGMYVRLAFAVAAHIDSDVLLIDEVLAVGDEGFREKCLEKMETEAASGRTIVFVTHDTQAVNRFCDRVIHLHKGVMDFDGQVSEGIARYEEACGLGPKARS